MSDSKSPKASPKLDDSERGAAADQAFVATLPHGRVGGHATGRDGTEEEGSVYEPAEGMKGKQRFSVKRERRFLLKLDLYLITWAFCAYLIKVGG
jgi:hypothetical protein